MSDADYVVIRYTPDPARNEALNIGVLAWTGIDMQVKIDDNAVARVVRENPQLETDALLYLEDLILSGFAGAGSSAEVLQVLGHQPGFPVSFTDPRQTSVLPGGSLEETMERLVTRIVTPRRRTGGGGASPASAVHRRLRALKASPPVMRNHFIEASASGAPRAVDFFVNHGANKALDVLRLNVSQADEIRRRADAQAFKVWDVIQKNEVKFTVLCACSSDRQLTHTYDLARRTIEAAGAAVVTSTDEAVKSLVGQPNEML